MKIYGVCAVILCLPLMSQAFAQTIYRGVEQRGYTPPVNHHPNPVFNHQAPQANYRAPAYPRDPYYPHSRYPNVVSNRPQVSIVTPHVGIYIDPEPSYRYQKTEEVYLPYGGTYRSVTEYVPQTTSPYAPKRKVLNSGYYSDEYQH